MLADAVRTYFSGERALGFALVVVGCATLAAVVFVWRTQATSFALGLGVPLLLFALGAGIGGAFLERRSADQLERFTVEARERPAQLVADERVRMERVNANWPRIKLAWAVLAVIGLLLVNVVKRDAATGVGLALLLIAALLTAVDVFAARRAQPYSQALADAGAAG